MGRAADDFEEIARQKASLGLNRDGAYPSQDVEWFGGGAPPPVTSNRGKKLFEPPMAVEGLCPYCYGDLGYPSLGRPADCTGACQGA